MRKKFMLVLSLLTVSAGCVGGGVAPGELAVDMAELRTQVVIDSTCTPAEQAKIAPAIEELGSFLVDTSAHGALPIMLDTVMNGLRRSPEYQLALLRTDVPTTVSCSATACGNELSCGTSSSTAEQLTLRTATVDDPETTTDMLAGSLGLALGQAHHLGYGSLFLITSVVIELGVEFHTVFSTARSAFTGETELPVVGAGAGTSFTMRCAGPTEMARGIHVDAQLAGPLTFAGPVTGLALRCDQSSSPEVGSGGGLLNRASELRCAAGEILVGISADDGTSFHRIVAHCRSESDVRAGLTTPTHDLATGSGSPVYDRMCPTGMAVRRISGYAANSPGALQVICQDPAERPRGEIVSAARLGNPATFPQISTLRCLGFGYVEVLIGQWRSVTDRLERIELGCRSTTLPAGTSIPVPDFDRHWADEFGMVALPDDSLTDVSACNDDECLVGMNGLSADGMLFGLEPLCAVRADWYGPAPTVASRVAAPLVVNPKTTYQRATSFCGRGSEIVGLQIGATAGLALGAVTPLCRSLAPVQ